jgi:peptide/nickel transport system substrate-binding protein
MARTSTGELVPGLAAEAPTQVDDLTWEFKLREGVTFHNGEPFNADAVVASVARVMDPANNSEQLGLLRHHRGGSEGRRPDCPRRHQRPRPDPALAHVLDEDDPAGLR